MVDFCQRWGAVLDKTVQRLFLLLVIAGLAFIVVGALVGCKSGTHEIARAANSVDMLATNVDTHTNALEPLVADKPEAKPHIAGLRQAAADLHIEAQRVHEALPRVKDVTPWWATLLGNGFLALIAVLIVGGVIWLLYACGFGAPLTAFFAFLNSVIARLIPHPIKSRVAAFKAKRA